MGGANSKIKSLFKKKGKSRKDNDEEVKSSRCNYPGGDSFQITSTEYPDSLNPFAKDEDDKVETGKVESEYVIENVNKDTEMFEISPDYDENKNPFYKEILQDMMKSAQNNISLRNTFSHKEAYALEECPLKQNKTVEKFTIESSKKVLGNMIDKEKNDCSSDSLKKCRKENFEISSDYDESKNPFYEDIVKEIGIKAHLSENFENELQKCLPESGVIVSNEITTSNITETTRSKKESSVSNKDSRICSYVNPVHHRSAPPSPLTPLFVQNSSVKSKISAVKSDLSSPNGYLLSQLQENPRQAPAVPISSNQIIRCAKPNLPVPKLSYEVNEKLSSAPAMPIPTRRNNRSIRRAPPVSTSSEAENEKLKPVPAVPITTRRIHGKVKPPPPVPISFKAEDGKLRPVATVPFSLKQVERKHGRLKRIWESFKKYQ